MILVVIVTVTLNLIAYFTPFFTSCELYDIVVTIVIVNVASLVYIDGYFYIFNLFLSNI